MVRVAGNFMKAGVVYAAIGFALGLAMAAGNDFALRSVHAHLNLVGWTTMGIYAAFYQLVPKASESGIAKLHFWIANAGLILLSAGVALLAKGFAAASAGAAAGSIITLISLLLFAYIVFKSA